MDHLLERFDTSDYIFTVRVVENNTLGPAQFNYESIGG